MVTVPLINLEWHQPPEYPEKNPRLVFSSVDVFFFLKTGDVRVGHRHDNKHWYAARLFDHVWSAGDVFKDEDVVAWAYLKINKPDERNLRVIEL